MSGFPDPMLPEEPTAPENGSEAQAQGHAEEHMGGGSQEEPANTAIVERPAMAWRGDGAPRTSFFSSYEQNFPPPPRFPNLLDVVLAGILLCFGFFCSGALMELALHFHFYGVTTIKGALSDIHYTLGSQVAWYVITFSGCALLFPMVWHMGFFEGVEWRAHEAVRLRWRLFRAAFVCFVLALIDGFILPGPPEAPIDQVFRMPGAAWLLFAFGITLAPFIEELGFRGFLLPALCTASDWSMERVFHRPRLQPDPDGKTRWSPRSMIVASVVTSIPFALMHAPQVGYSLGPCLLLVCVSLVLCWVRLSTRSLAASTLVHASYNLLLFILMIAGTGGFRHLDRL